MPLTIAICDDNEEQISVLRQLLGEWAEDKPFALDIDEYVSAKSFLFSYPDNPCGLLLLDIEMRELNGMALAKKLRENGDMLPIVFVTGYSEYMSEGYEVEALHYLLKPVNRDKLFSVLNRYVKRMEPVKEILLRSGDRTIHAAAEAIVFCEAMGKKTRVKMSDGQTVMCDIGINGLMKILTEDFMFCHRSYIVNLRYVRSIGREGLRLDGEETVPVSRRLYGDINKKFIGFYTR